MENIFVALKPATCLNERSQRLKSSLLLRHLCNVSPEASIPWQHRFQGFLFQEPAAVANDVARVVVPGSETFWDPGHPSYLFDKCLFLSTNFEHYCLYVPDDAAKIRFFGLKVPQKSVWAGKRSCRTWKVPFYGLGVELDPHGQNMSKPTPVNKQGYLFRGIERFLETRHCLVAPFRRQEECLLRVHCHLPTGTKWVPNLPNGRPVRMSSSHIA